MRRTGTRDLQDMDSFEKFVRKRFVFMRWYRGVLSMIVAGFLVVSILLSLIQVGSLLCNMGQAVAALAGTVLPWTLSFFAVACAWWCIAPPSDPQAYISNLNDGMRFLNLAFDVSALSFRHTAPLPTTFPSPPSPSGGMYYIHPPSLPQLANQGGGGGGASAVSRPSTPPPSPLSGSSTQPQRTHFVLSQYPQHSSHWPYEANPS